MSASVAQADESSVNVDMQLTNKRRRRMVKLIDEARIGREMDEPE